jgi:hypothetical protein
MPARPHFPPGDILAMKRKDPVPGLIWKKIPEPGAKIHKTDKFG